MTAVTVLAALVLGIALAAAVWHDVRTRKIPNRLILLGTLAALLLHTLLRSGAGLFATPAGGQGMLFSLAGFAVGLLLLLPFYALKTMGAGDVKLAAMVGAFLGAKAMIGATLLSMLAGGVLALAVALWSGQLAQVMRNLQHMMRPAGLRADTRAPEMTGKLPYAIAIACGSVGQLLLAGRPGWTLFS